MSDIIPLLVCPTPHPSLNQMSYISSPCSVISGRVTTWAYRAGIRRGGTLYGEQGSCQSRTGLLSAELTLLGQVLQAVHPPHRAA